MSKPFLILCLVLLLGIAVRNAFLPQNLLFGFEQGRDFTIAKDIGSFKKLTLLGPKTDIEGIYHGVFYYYLLAFLISLAKGNPENVAFLFNLLNLSTIVTVYFICWELFRTKKAALFGAFLTGISFNVLIYGRWISNVSPSVPLTAVFFLFIIKFLKTGQSKFLPFIFLCWGLFLHFEILNFLSATFVIFVLSIVLVFRRKKFVFRVNPLLLTFSIFIFGLSFLPFLMFETRHNFLLSKSVFRYIIAPQSQHFSIINNIRNYFHGLNHEVITTLFPFARIGFLAIIFYVLIIFSTLGRLLKAKLWFIPLLFLFWQLPLIFFLRHASLEQFFSGTNVAIIISAVSMFTYLKKSYLSKVGFFFLFAIYIYINTSYTISALNTRQDVYFHMPYKEITYGRQREVFDYLAASNAVNYDFDVFTTPIYHPEGWHYIRQQFYNKKPNASQKKLFLVIEPFVNNFWLGKWIEDYNKISVLLKEQKTAGMIIQERQYLK